MAAESDPDEAVGIVERLHDPNAVQDAMDLVVLGALESHADDVPRLAGRMKNEYRKSKALAMASRKMAEDGRIESARDICRAVTKPEHRCVAMASIGAATGDTSAVLDALRMAVRDDPVGQAMKEIAQISIRKFGFGATKALICAAVPGIQSGWTDLRIYPLLQVPAYFDPAWALDVLKRGPHLKARRNGTVPENAVSNMLLNFVGVDSSFVAQCIQDSAGKEHPQGLEDIKDDIILALARQSETPAMDFVKLVNAKHSIPASELSFMHVAGRIKSAPAQIDHEMDAYCAAANTNERDFLNYMAVELFDSPYGYLGIESVLAMADALKDPALKDVLLLRSFRQLILWDEKKEATRMAERIKSPSMRLETIVTLVHGMIFPRQWEKKNKFLTEW